MKWNTKAVLIIVLFSISYIICFNFVDNQFKRKVVHPVGQNSINLIEKRFSIIDELTYIFDKHKKAYYCITEAKYSKDVEEILITILSTPAVILVMPFFIIHIFFNILENICTLIAYSPAVAYLYLYKYSGHALIIIILSIFSIYKIVRKQKEIALLMVLLYCFFFIFNILNILDSIVSIVMCFYSIYFIFELLPLYISNKNKGDN